MRHKIQFWALLALLFVCHQGYGTVFTVTITPSTKTICKGSVIQMNVVADEPKPTGIWTSDNEDVATVSADGKVTAVGLVAGSATISFNAGSGTIVGSAVITVTTSDDGPGPITGGAFMCQGATKTLAATATDGTWSSTNTSVATIDATSGAITAATMSGTQSGTTTITYTRGGDCYSTIEQTVNPIIAGYPYICIGATSTIEIATTTTGGTWSSSNDAVATASIFNTTRGTMHGVSYGTATITYHHPESCYRTINLQVGMPALTLPTTLCVGGTGFAYSNFDVSPTNWASSTPGVASIEGINGKITAVSAGTTTITYTANPGAGDPGNICYQTGVVTVYASPAAISGYSTVCAGGTITLSNTSAGGTWSSSMPDVASIDAAGVVSGIIPGTTIITYDNGCGTPATKEITVIASGFPISGPTHNICVGSSVTLTVSDGTSGTWTSSAPSVATAPGGGVVTGQAAGTSIITYMATTGCYSTFDVTVYSLPTISGSSSVCTGSTITLTGSAPGGTWASSSTSVATIGASTGVVSGIIPGSTTITYTQFGLAACRATTALSVFSNTLANPTGITNTCVGSTTTLSHITPGGTWTSGGTSIATINSSGIVSGIAAGTAMITYTAASGCFVPIQVSVTLLTIAPSGSTPFCPGNLISLTKTPSAIGGLWSSSTPTTATINSSGVITGVAAGTTTITFATQAGASYSCIQTLPITINPNPEAITGPSAVCVGSTITLADATSGGTWSISSPATHATISSTGEVTGLSGPAGKTVTFTVTTTGCKTTRGLTVNSLPNAISGTKSVCVGSTTTLTSSTAGGTWSSTLTSVATTSSTGTTGVIAGVAYGTSTISYTLSTGCARSVEVTVNCTSRPGGNNTQAVTIKPYIISPNPSDGNFIITGAQSDKPLDVRVINNVGSVVYNGQLNMATGESKLSLDKLATGLYIVELKDEDGYSGTQKIVIEK